MDDEPACRDIVRSTGGPTARAAATAGGAASLVWRAEHLAVPGTGHLHLDPLPSDDDVAVQLARRVALDPGDARLHVARVNHHVLQRDGDGAYAALLDLYLAFGPTGTGLRRRLLNGARQLIGPHRAAVLDRATDMGLTPATPVPPTPGAMLATGVTGTTAIVRRRTVRAAAS